MQPVYPYIAVEKVEDRHSNLVQTVEERPVVKIIGIPFVPAAEEPFNFSINNKVLVNSPPEEYTISGENLYFIHYKSIVSIV